MSQEKGERPAGFGRRRAYSGAHASGARQDADSLGADGRKTEGAFYLWRADEVAAALGGGPQAALFAARYGVRPEGNCGRSPRRRAAAAPRALCAGAPVAAMLLSVAWRMTVGPLHAAVAPGGCVPCSLLRGQRRLAQTVAPCARVRTATQPADRWRPRRRRSDPHGEFAGLNCLYEARSVADAAAAAGVPAGEADALLADAREKLHARRATRPRPHLDDKARPLAPLPRTAPCQVCEKH
jgi:hypothetical protein